MQIGMIGLGRMGANMTRRLLRGGHHCVVYDRSPAAVSSLVAEGAGGARSLEELVAALAPPRAVWLMLPAGEPTDQTVTALGAALGSGDVIIDGGNSHFRDDLRRAAALAARGVEYLDAGTSGGLWGLERGYCLMVGGARPTVERLDPLFRTLAPGRGELPRTPGRERRNGTAEQGYLHCGPVGAGHFVKMVHNGIEYGLMQAYAEGFNILKSADRAAGEPEQPSQASARANGVSEVGYTFDIADIAEVWRRGSVIGSWLLDLTAAALVEDPELEGYSGFVQDSGEGRWALATALDEGVPAEVLAVSLFARFRSRQTHTFAEKVLSAMRKMFGGHVEQPSGG